MNLTSGRSKRLIMLFYVYLVGGEYDSGGDEAEEGGPEFAGMEEVGDGVGFAVHGSP